MINKLSIFNRKLFLSALLVCICFILSSNASAQNVYYWVGGSGIWSDLTHWSTTSGGAGNGYGQIPTSTDTVYFDASSGTSFTCDLGNNSAGCAALHWSADTSSSISSLGSSIFSIHGSADFQVGAFSTSNKMWSSFAGTMKFMGDVNGNGVIDFQGLCLPNAYEVLIGGANTYTIVSDMGSNVYQGTIPYFVIQNTANVIAQAPLYLQYFEQDNVTSFTANKYVLMETGYSSDNKSSSIYNDSVQIDYQIYIADTSVVQFNNLFKWQGDLSVNSSSIVNFNKGMKLLTSQVSTSTNSIDNSYVTFAPNYVYQTGGVSMISAQLIANNAEIEVFANGYPSLALDLSGISAAYTTQIKNSIINIHNTGGAGIVQGGSWVDCSGTQVFESNNGNAGLSNLNVQSIHIINTPTSLNTSSIIDSVFVAKSAFSINGGGDTIKYLTVDSGSTSLNLGFLYITGEMHVGAGVSVLGLGVQGQVSLLSGAKLFLGQGGICNPQTLISNTDFSVAVASDVTASGLILKNSTMKDISTGNPLAPTVTATNSVAALGSTNLGWTVSGSGAGIAFYWVGPIPADTTNTALYGNANDPNNWSTNPSDQPGGGNNSGNTCLPSILDSLVFKNSSYVNIQGDIDWGTVNITGFLVTNSFNNLNLHGSFYNHSASSSISAMSMEFLSDLRVNNYIGADQPFCQNISHPKVAIEFTTTKGSGAPVGNMNCVSDFYPGQQVSKIWFQRGNFYSHGYNFRLPKNVTLDASLQGAHSLSDSLYVDFRKSSFICDDNCDLRFYRNVNVNFNAPDSIYSSAFTPSTGSSLTVNLYKGDSINYIETPGYITGQLDTSSFVGKIVVGNYFSLKTYPDVHVGNLYLVNNPLTATTVGGTNCYGTPANPVVIDTILEQAPLAIGGTGYMTVNLFNLAAGRNTNLGSTTVNITSTNGIVGGGCSGLATVTGGTFTSTFNQNVSDINLVGNIANGGGTFTYNNGTADAMTTGWVSGGTSLTARVLYWVGGTGEFNDNTHWSLTPDTMTDSNLGNSVALGNCPPDYLDDAHFTPGSFVSTNDTVSLVYNIINVHALYMNGKATLYANSNAQSNISASGDVYVGDSITISTLGGHKLENLIFSGSDSTHVYISNNQTIVFVKFNNTDSSKYYQLNGLGKYISGGTVFTTGIFDFNMPQSNPFLCAGTVVFFPQASYLTVRLNNSVLGNVFESSNCEFDMSSTFNFDAGTSIIIGSISKSNAAIPLRLNVLNPIQSPSVIGASDQNDSDYIHLVTQKYCSGDVGLVNGFARIDSVECNGKGLTINNSKYVGDVISRDNTDGSLDYLNMTNIDSLGTYILPSTSKSYGTLKNIGYARYIEHSSATTNLTALTLNKVAVDTFIMNADRAVYADTVKIHKLMDWKFGSRQVADTSSLLWLDNSAQFSAMGSGGGNEIYWQLSTNVSTDQAYVRKDSGQLCTDFIYMRGIQAIGNGTYPAAGGNPTIDTMLASSFYPTVATSGRAIFTAGLNADNQGQNAGWDFSAYPPYPDAAPDLNNIIACDSSVDSIYIPIQVLGSYPFDLSYWYVYDNSGTPDTLKVDTIPADPTALTGTGIPGDPYIFYIPIPKHSLIYPLGPNIPFGLTQISSDRCSPVSTALTFKTTLSGLGMDESFAFDSVLETSITNDDVKIKFSIVNDGALAIVGKIPVAMYNAADTSLLGLLWTDSTTTLKPGDTSVYYTITGSGIKNLGNFQVLLYLNSDGGGQLGTQFGECSYVGNVFMSKLLKITAQDDYDTVAEYSTSNVLNVLANDQYFDSTFTGLRVDSIWHQPKFGSIVSYDSVIRYNAPSIAASGGVDTLGYYVGDEFGRIDSAMVYITLDTSTNKGGIKADVVVWKLDSLASYTQAIAPDTAHVVALDLGGAPVPRANLTSDTLDFNAIQSSAAVGAYPMTYHSPYDSVANYVFVLNNDTIVPDTTHKEVLGANNFVWAIKNLSSLNGYVAKDTAKVTAFDFNGTSIDTSLITTNAAQMSTILSQTSPSVWPLSFSTVKGTLVTIKAFLKGDSTNGPIPPVIGKDTIITANNFIWKLKNLAALTDATSRDSSKVFALDSLLNVIPQSEIFVNAGELAAIKAQTISVVMPLSYSTGTKVVHVNVFLEGDSTNGPIPPAIGTDTIITASNFSWNIKKLSSLTDSTSRDSSKVAAIDSMLNLIPQSEIFVDTAQLSSIKAQTLPALMPLSYSTGTKVVHINVFLRGDSSNYPIDSLGKDTIITANNFTWKLKNLAALTDATSRDSSKVFALDSLLNVIPQNEIFVNAGELAAIKAQTISVVMPLSYSTGTKVVHVNVFLEGDSTNGPIPPAIGTDTIITASNFSWNIKKLSLLTDSTSRDSSKVAAIDSLLNIIPQSEIFIDTAQLATIKAQTLPTLLPLSYRTGTKVVHINVFLRGDSSNYPIDSVGKDTIITANNFTWKLKNLAALTDLTSRDSSGVAAIDSLLQPIPQNEIFADTAELASIKSQTTSVVMPLSYRTGTKVVHINVFLEGDSTNGPIPPAIGTDTIITASNFSWDIKTMGLLTDSVSRDSSGVAAIDSMLKIIPQSEIFIDTSELANINAQTKPGIMPLSYSTGTKVVHINVFMLGDSSNYPIDSLGKDTVITANNFTWKLKNLGAFTDLTSRDSSGVMAFDSLLHVIPQNEIFADAAELASIQSQTTSVVMPLSYRTGTKVVHVNVFLEGDSTNGPIPPAIGTDTIITASNFSWDIKTMGLLTDSVSRDSSGVAAIDSLLNIIPQSEIFIDTSELANINAQTKPGIMPLSYSTGTKVVHINVFMLGDSSNYPIDSLGKDTVITANNFTWKLKNLGAFTDLTSRDSSGVIAFDSLLHVIPQNEIFADAAELASIQSQTTSVVMPLSYRTGTKIVHVNVFLEGDSTNGPIPPVIGVDTIITASNFSWNIKKLSLLTDSTSRDSSKVAAIDSLLNIIPQSEIFIDTAQLATIKAQTLPTLLPLSYRTGTKVVHINVFLRGDSSNYPIDSVGKDTIITANNFTWKLKNLAALTDLTSRDSSGVAAIDSLLQPIPQNEIFADTAELASIKSQTTSVVMPLSYRTGTKVVHINVFLEGDSTNGPIPPAIGTDTIITASNFSWDIKTMGLLTDSVSRDSSGVAAIDSLLNIIPQSEIFIDTSELANINAQTKPGIMPLSYSTGTKVVHINVFMLGDSSNYPIDSLGKDTVITANNFTWKLKNLGAFTDLTSRDSSGVIAFDSLLHVIPQNEIFADAAELASIQSQTTSVVMPLSYRTGTKVVHVNVFLEGDSTNGPIPPAIGTDTIITASNFSWDIKTMGLLTDSVSRDSSGVAAIDSLLNIIPQSEIFIDTSELANINAQTKPGIMPLSYSTGTKVVHINVFMLGDSSNYPIDSLGKDTVITANNFTWKLKNLGAFTDLTSRDSSGVIAFDSLLHVIPQNEIFADAAELASIQSQTTSVVMPLSYRTGTKIVHVNVFLEGDSTNGPIPPVIGVDTIITASNFSWNIKKLSLLTDSTSRDSSGVAAIDSLLNIIPQSEIFIDTAQLATIKAQTLPTLLPLSYRTGTKVVHINVFLRGDSSNYPIDSVGKDTIITANNFTWKLKNLAALTDLTSRDSSGVAAIDSLLQPIPQNEIFADTAELASIKSQTTSVVMPLSYRTGTKVVHINVFLEGDSTNGPIPPAIGTDTIITASNFSWDIKTMGLLTDSVSRDSSGVAAIDSLLNIIPQSEIFIDTSELANINAQTKPGIMPLSYSTGTKVVHINVFMLGDSSNYPIDSLGKDTVITANNFTWKLKNLGAFTDLTSRDSSGVIAFDSLLHVIPQNEIFADPAELASIQSQTTSVVMPLSYRTGTKVVHINVFLEGDSTNGPIPPAIGTDTIITASNFSWDIKTMGLLTDSVSRDSSGVAAIDSLLNIIPQSEIFIDTSELANINAQTKPGIMPLSYSTGTKVVHINVFMLGDSSNYPIDSLGKDTIITANNFTWKLKNLGAFTDLTSRDSSGVIAFDSLLHVIPQNEIFADAAELASIQSQTTSVVMPLSYRTGTKIVHVNVFLEGDSTNGPIPPVIGVDTIITASNFSWNIKKLSLLTDSTSRDSSGVAAIDSLLNIIPQSEIFIDTAQLATIKAQTLPTLLPLSYRTGTKVVHINVFLRGDSSNYPIDSVGKDTIITANNFTWKLKNLAALTDLTSRDSSGVAAIDSLLQPIPQNEIFADTAELASIKSQTTSVVMPLSYRTGTKVVHINVFLEGDSTNGPIPPAIGTDTIITASNFSWDIKTMGLLTDSVSRDSSGVAAIDSLLHIIPQSEIFIDTSELANINAQTKPGIMPLSYSTGTKVVHINVFMLGDSSNYPIDSLGKDTVITANNFTWKLKNLGAFTDLTSRDSSGVIAFDSLLHVIPQNEIFADAAELASIQSQTTSVVMPLSYRTGTKVVHVNVFLEGDSTNGPIPPAIGTDTIITASNFSWDIKTMGLLTDSVSRDSSGVAAIDSLLNIIPQSEIFIDTSELANINAQTKPGIMPLSYNTGTKVVHINVFMLGDSSNYPIDSLGKDTIITANNFTWKLKNLGVFTDLTSRDSSGVMAFDSLLHVIPQNEIFADTAELASIKSQTTSVVMPLSYRTGTKIVHVNVFLEGDSTNGPIPPAIGTDTIITASNFSWDIKTMGLLTDSVSRDSSGVAAIDSLLHIIPQSEIFIDTSELANINAQTKPGIMPLSYSTGTKVVHINVFMLGDSSNYPIDSLGKDTVITANNFTWKLKNLGAFTDLTSRDSSGVIAFDSLLHVIPQNEIFADTAELASIKSQTTSVVMPLSYRTGTKVVHINVFLEGDSTNGPIPPAIGTDTIITASNFSWNIKKLSLLTDSTSRDSSKVAAIDSLLNIIPQSEIFIDTAQLATIKAQTLPTLLPLSYRTGTKVVHINVFLRGDSSNYPIDSVGKDTIITANNFTWKLKNLAALTDLTSRDSSGVAAIDSLLQPIPQNEIFADTAELASIKSQTTSVVMPLSYRTGTKVVHINVFLEGDSTNGPIPPAIGADTIITASNFSWDIKTMGLLTDSVSRDSSGVAAIDSLLHIIPQSEIFIDTSELANINAQTKPGIMPLSYSTGTKVVHINVFMLGDSSNYPIDSLGKDTIITANNFTWKLKNLGAFTDLTSRDSSGVMAFDSLLHVIPQNEIFADPAELATIKAQTAPIVMPLSYTTGTKTVHINVFLTGDSTSTSDSSNVPGVLGKDTIITANNFIWNIKDLASLTDSTSRDTSKVFAIDSMLNTIPQAQITMNAVEFAAIQAQTTPVVLPLSYTTGSKTVHINVMLLGDSTNKGNGGDSTRIGIDTIITASNFIWSVRDLALLTDLSSRDTSHVFAIDENLNTIPQGLINVDAAELATIKAQTSSAVWPLSYTTGTHTVHINVTLLNNDTIVPKADGSSIGADVVFWNLKDLASYTLAIAPDTAHVHAFDKNLQPVLRANINADLADYNNIMSKDTVGSYPMQYSSPDTSVIAPVFVFDHDSVTPNPTAKEVIAARDFVWPFRDRVNMNASKSKNAAKVIAFAYDGSSIPRASITANAADLGVLQNELTVGSDSLTFTTPSGQTSTRIKVTLVDNDTTTIDSITGEAIGANDFAWNIRDINTLTKSISKDTAHVNAEYRDGSVIPRDSITVDPAQFAAITAQPTPGIWPLTYTTPNGVSVTVNVALLDNDSIHVDPVDSLDPSKGNEVIGADNFAFYVESLDTLDDVVARDTAHTKAFNMLTGAEILRNTLLVDPTMLTTIKAQTDVIMLPLKFATPNGTATTINVTLMVDSTGTYNPTCREYLGGRDFSWSIDSLNSLDEAAMYTAGKIRGIHTDGSGKMIPTSEIILNPNDVSAIQNAGNSPDTTIALRYTTVSNCVEDTLLVHINGSVITNPDFAIAGKVLSVPLALCTNTCDVDQDYVLTSQLGVDTMKNQAKVKITLQGSYHVNATIHFNGAVGLYTSSVADGGIVALNSQGGSSQAELSIDRNNVSPDITKEYLTVYVTIAGKTDSIKILFSKDFDEDGIDNVIERSACIKKTEGIFNEWYYNDPYGDADHDGVPDIVEAHGTMDSLYNTFTLPGACIPDFQNDDSNGDGVPDGNEKFTDNTGDTINDRDIYVRPAVSANADGLGDDKMFIENINFYSHNSVTIFDRVGRVLYQMDGYNNADKAFDGYPNKANNNDKKVPMGTYYYYVEYTSDKTHITRSKAGFIEVRY